MNASKKTDDTEGKKAKRRGALSNKSLLALLQDPDEMVASLAMEQAPTGKRLMDFVAANQESSDPVLRRRIHQLGKIAEQRMTLQDFGESCNAMTMCPWDAAITIDLLYDPKSSEHYLTEALSDFLSNFNPVSDVVAMKELGLYMKCRSYRLPPHPWFNIGYYLIGDVLETGLGVPVLLCILAQRAALINGTKLAICLYHGRFCLFDESFAILDPSNDWAVIPPQEKPEFELCKNTQVIQLLLAQAYCAALATWETFDAHIFQQLLCKSNPIAYTDFPYPLGDFLKEESLGDFSS